MWSILSALHPPERDPKRLPKYQQYKNELNFENINFPVKIKDIPIFESQNKINITIFGYEVKN
jgi:hypothetical protein